MQHDDRLPKEQSIMNPQELLAHLRNGRLPPGELRLFGRLGRVGGDRYPDRLSMEPDRPFAWLFDGDTLRGMIGKNPREVARSLGKTDKVIDEAVAKGQRWYLVVCQGDEVRPANWGTVLERAAEVHPAAANRVLRHRAALEAQAILELLGDEGRRRAYESRGREHPDHMTTEAFLSGPDTAQRLRVWLWHSLGVNDVFRGDGWTSNDGSSALCREYFAENRLLRADDAIEFLDIRP